MRLVEKRQIPNFEVYVDGKKDEELTVKAKKALEFIKRYDEVAGNQLSILDWDSELLNCYFDNFEKSMKDKFSIKSRILAAVRRILSLISSQN